MLDLIIKGAVIVDGTKSDDQIREVARTGGYIGLLIVPGFLQEQKEGTLQVFIRHLEHLLEVAGPDAVGIGTDYGTCFDWPSVERPTAERASLVADESPRPLAQRMSQYQTYLTETMDWVGFGPDHR